MHLRSVSLFPPIVHGHPPGVLPSRVPVEEHEIGALAMPCSRYSPFTAQPPGGRSRRIRQMNWRPDIVQVLVPDNIGSRKNRTPRSIFIAGEIDCFRRLLDSGYLVKTIQIDADHVLWTAELPCIDHVTHHLPFVGITLTGVNLDPSILVSLRGVAAQVWDVDQPPIGFVAAAFAAGR